MHPHAGDHGPALVDAVADPAAAELPDNRAGYEYRDVGDGLLGCEADVLDHMRNLVH